MRSISEERRNFLKRAGLVGLFAMMPLATEGSWAFAPGPQSLIEDAVVSQQLEEPPAYHIKFAVCGMSRDHIYRMLLAMFASTGSRRTASEHGATAASSFLRPMDTSRFVSTSTWRSNTRGTTSSWSTASRRDTSTARTCLCRSGPQFVYDVVNRTHTAQNQAEWLPAAELVIKCSATQSS